MLSRGRRTGKGAGLRPAASFDSSNKKRVRVADDMAFGFSIEDRFEPEGRSDVLELGSRFGG